MKCKIYSLSHYIENILVLLTELQYLLYQKIKYKALDHLKAVLKKSIIAKSSKFIIFNTYAKSVSFQIRF